MALLLNRTTSTASIHYETVPVEEKEAGYWWVRSVGGIAPSHCLKGTTSNKLLHRKVLHLHLPLLAANGDASVRGLSNTPISASEKHLAVSHLLIPTWLPKGTDMHHTPASTSWHTTHPTRMAPLNPHHPYLHFTEEQTDTRRRKANCQRPLRL